MFFLHYIFIFFFFNDTATTEIYPLSLHDALPISLGTLARGRRRYHCLGALLITRSRPLRLPETRSPARSALQTDRKSTRLNSSHVRISYAVFCLKKKNTGITSQSLNLKQFKTLIN